MHELLLLLIIHKLIGTYFTFKKLYGFLCLLAVFLYDNLLNNPTFPQQFPYNVHAPIVFNLVNIVTYQTILFIYVTITHSKSWSISLLIVFCPAS